MNNLETFKCADKLLYEVKAKGRNNYQIDK